MSPMSNVSIEKKVSSFWKTLFTTSLLIIFSSYNVFSKALLLLVFVIDFPGTFLFAASVNCPVIDNQRKSAKVAQAWLGWGGRSGKKTSILIFFNYLKYFLLECSDTLV